MKLVKRLRASFGIHALKVTIRPHQPWYWRHAVLILLFILFIGMSWWLFQSNQRLAGFDRTIFEHQLDSANEVSKRLAEENQLLKSKLNELSQQRQIEQVSQIELSKNIARLQDENARLKEEISFFHSIASSNKVSEGLDIQNFQVERDVLPGEYKFHALLIQGGARIKEFVGKAQLIVNVQNHNGSKILTFPDSEKSASVFEINLKHYQRLEGRFKVDVGTVIKSVQLRITDRATGQLRLTRSLSLS